MRKLSKVMGAGLGTFMMFLASANSVFAQAGPATGSGFSIEKILQLLKTWLGYFAIFVFLMAVAAVLYAAFLFFTSGGNEEKVSTAKRVLIYALIGIAVAVFAYYAIPFVCSLLQLGAGCGGTSF